MKRVVVTGMSLVSSLGHSLNSSWAALIAGQYYLGKLQVTGASLNLTINSLNVQVASTQTDLKVISGLNIVQDISGCRAQSPCDVQPIIQLVDQNVINLKKQYLNSIFIYTYRIKLSISSNLVTN